MASYGTQSHYSDQRFAAVDGNVGDFPPLYSDLPFQRRRKYGNSGNDAIKWAMRCVLASPVLVLCLWTVGAFVFANKHASSSSMNTVNGMEAQTVMLKARPAQMSQSQPIQVMMMPPPNAQLPLQQPPQSQLVQQQQQQQQQLPLQPPLQQQSVEQDFPQAQETWETLPPQEAPANAYQQAAPLQQMPPPPQQLEPQLQQQQQPVLQASRGKRTRNQRPAAHHNHPQQQPPPPPPLVPQQQTRQQILYYEPSHATANGKLEVPLTVYDVHGNPIPLQHLRGAAITMEPPTPRKLEGPTEVLANPQQMAISPQDIQKWGESTAQDQSIIVGTVAVMALLVGAISARRMRSRNYLSMWIENEALEDDVAYDTAYTTTNKDNSYYNTFASGGWKGDLEKFDV